MRIFKKLNTLLSSANILETLLKKFLLCDLMTSFARSLIYALPKFNWNLMSAGNYLYFLTGNLAQNVYNGKFLNVGNEDILTNARN